MSVKVGKSQGVNEGLVRQSEEELRQACSLAGLGHFEYDHDTSSLVCNDIAGSLLGLNGQGSVNFSTVLLWVAQSRREQLEQRLNELLEGKTDQIETELSVNIRKTRRLDLLMKMRRIPGSAKSEGRIFGIVQDITTEKMARDKILRQDLHLDQACEMAGVSYWEFDHVLNQGSGYNIAGSEGKGGQFFTKEMIENIVHPDDRQIVENSIEMLWGEKKQIDVAFRIIVDGKIRHVHAKSVTSFDQRGRPLRSVGITQDITSHEVMKEDMLYHKKFLETLVDTIPFGVLVKDVRDDLKFVVWNKFMADYFNISAKRAIGKTDIELATDGIRSKRYRDEDEWVIANLKPLKTEMCSFEIDGQKRCFSYEKYPIQDSKGKCRYIVAILTDLTERFKKEKQLIDANRELLRSNKDLQQFAYVSSHDLKEPLRMVTSYLELLERMYADSLDDEARLYINFAVEGALRMNNLLDCLLQYSRITSDCKITEPVRCTDVLTAVIKSLKYDIDISGATIEMDDLPIVHGSKNQLFHLFRHLISNSMKYRRNDAAPVIAVRAEKTGGGSYVFSVEDNGIGIEKQYHQKIFDIFQRVHSRDSYGGYGLGLAVCRRIVERHNGRIWVESQPEKGTKVLFTLS